MKPDSFSLPLCEKNAAAEGVKNASLPTRERREYGL